MEIVSIKHKIENYLNSFSNIDLKLFINTSSYPGDDTNVLIYIDNVSGLDSVKKLSNIDILIVKS